MLAVVKAGAACLPLDPQYPPHRLAQVLERSRSPLVLASEALGRRCGGVWRACRRGLVRLWCPWRRARRRAREEDLPARCALSNLAYVIFTSGSTGMPKGAMLEHRGMLNHLHAKLTALGLGPADRLAQTASQCFDISVWRFCRR